MGFLTLDLRENASQRLATVETANCQKAIRYALASTAKFLRDEIKRQGIMGSHGGYLGWPQDSPFTGTLAKPKREGSWNRQYRGRGKGRYRLGSKSESGFNPLNLSTKTEPMAKLVSAVRSKTDSGAFVVRIGFIDSRLQGMMEKQQTGFSTPVTPRMRRLFFGLGLAIPAQKTEITDPARAWIDTVYTQEMGNARKHFDYAFHWGFSQLEGGATSIISPGVSII